MALGRSGGPPWLWIGVGAARRAGGRADGAARPTDVRRGAGIGVACLLLVVVVVVALLRRRRASESDDDAETLKYMSDATTAYLVDSLVGCAARRATA